MQARLFYCLLLIVDITTTTGLIQRNYAGRPCPNEMITLTCTVPGVGISWVLDNDVRIDLSTAGPEASVMGHRAVQDNATNSTHFVSTLFTTAVDGQIISCENLGVHFGNVTIMTRGRPSSPMNINYTILSTSLDRFSTSLRWDPLTDSGSRDDVSYTVTIPQLSYSETVVTSTSVTVTDADYNVNYTVNVVATNCAGNSYTLQYSFRVATCADPVFNTGVTLRSDSRTVYIEGNIVAYSCPDTTAIQSTCGSDRQWSPDTTSLGCPSIVTCAPPSPPANGSIVDNVTDSSLVEAVIYYRCDVGLFPVGDQPLTCGSDGNWTPNTQNPLCFKEPFNCTIPDPLPNGFVVERSNTTIVFVCNKGFSPQQNTMARCVAEDQWNPEIVCTQAIASPIDPIVGGGVGGLLFLIVLIVIIIVLLVVSKRRDKYNAPDRGIEMTEQLQGDYSQLTHTGPRNGRQNRAPGPEVDGYNRIDHPLDAVPNVYDDVTLNSEQRVAVNSDGYNALNGDQGPQRLPGYGEVGRADVAPDAYDDVTLNSEQRVAVNTDGYSALNSDQGPQRLPGYGEVGHANPVEPLIYADVTPRGARQPNQTQQVDQHRVDYASVDHLATERRAATLPASPERPPAPNPAGDPDRLLDLDQALIQLRAVHARWQDLGNALQVPETYIQQIEETCPNDNNNAMTEVVEYWMRSCSGRPTWRELADGLRRIREGHLAQQLMSIYDTGCLPVELDMNAVPPDVYQYDRAPPPPLPARSGTTDSPELSRTLPPRHGGDSQPSMRPPRAATVDDFSLPPRPPKPSKH